MSEQGAAHKNSPPSPTNGGEEEYDSIFRALAETAQGRRFLDEFARRHATGAVAGHADAGRKEPEKRSTAAESLDLFLFDIADMAQAIARTKAEIASIKQDAVPQAGIGEATGELHSIVDMTESATSRILAAAERVQEFAWTLREKGTDESLCDELDAQATEIYTACSFQDLTGQRTSKVIQVLRYLEYRVNAMIEIWSKNSRGVPAASEAPPPAEQPGGAAATDSSHFSSGGLGQADVDLMMELRNAGAEEIQTPATAYLQERLHVLLPDDLADEFPQNAQEADRAELPQGLGEEHEAREQRQDATLEDIERVMMALDPFAAMSQEKTDLEQPAVAEARAEAPPFFVEQRPELLIPATPPNKEAAAAKSPVEAPVKEAAVTAQAPDAMEATDTSQPQDVAATEAAPQEPAVEFGVSARTAAVLLQVQAAASKPAAEPAWSVLERLALNLLPQELRPNSAPLPERPEAAAKPAGPMPAKSALSFAFMPAAELNIPAAPAKRSDEPSSPIVDSAENPSTKPNEAAAVEEAPVAPAPEAARAAPVADAAPLSEAVPTPEAAPAHEAPPAPETVAVSDTDAEEFLFGPKQPETEGDPAGLVQGTKPTPAAPRFDDLLASALNLGAEPAAATPPNAAAARQVTNPASRAVADPLAPLRALSDEQKIALFS